MKICIITGHFFPQLHPRAFRANELALEFARRGHHVTMVNCWRIKDFDYEKYGSEHGITIHNLDIFVTSQEGITASKKSGSHKMFSFLKEYLLAGSLFYRGPLIGKKLHIENDTDIVIALSTPFTCLFGLRYYAKKNGKKWFAIADSGDPFYNSKQSPKAFWFKYIERDVYKSFDYLTIPTENAIPLYSPMISKAKIKVIPQGFRMDNLKLYGGELEPPVKFAYAGVFYWDIRNPEFLFQFLDKKVDTPFEFHIFMRDCDAKLDEELNKYPSLTNKVKIRYSVPHDELLYELSKMHFLVNIENLSNTQMPSKLIDYGMTKRPIYSCNKYSFSEEVFMRFIDGDYNSAYKINLRDYDIVNIANQFLNLSNKGQ